LQNAFSINVQNLNDLKPNHRTEAILFLAIQILMVIIGDYTAREF